MPNLLAIQKNELNEYLLYKKILKLVKNPKDRAIVETMVRQEKNHHDTWQDITKQTVSPSRIKIWMYYAITRMLGLSFGLKLMEKGEKLVGKEYAAMTNEYPAVARMLKEEQEHEQALLSLIDHQALANVSAVILGLNDAIVELTGALAGLTLALAHTRLISMVGLITGIAASLSMGISSYLAAQEDDTKRTKAVAIGFTTGVSYILTVMVLIIPYALFSNPFAALIGTLLLAVLIMLGFNFYTSVSRHEPFKKKFLQMATLSLGAAAINFGIGFVIKKYFDA